MKVAVLSILLALNTMLVGCSSATAVQHFNETSISFRMTMSIGGGLDGLTKLQIEGNGHATYTFKEGHWHDGPWSENWRMLEFRVPYNDMVSLRDKVHELGIMALDEDYDNPAIADGTTRILELQFDTPVKRIYCRPDAPQAYMDFEKYVREYVLKPARQLESQAVRVEAPK